MHPDLAADEAFIAAEEEEHLRQLEQMYYEEAMEIEEAEYYYYKDLSKTHGRTLLPPDLPEQYVKFEPSMTYEDPDPWWV